MIVQSGIITPGHLVDWITDGVVGDAGPALAGNKVLGSIFMADFNSTFDQPITLAQSLTAFQLSGIIVTNASVSLTSAIGGFYPLASKAGSSLVLASQAYSSLTGPNILLQPSLTAYATTTRFSRSVLTSSWAIYLSLSTAQGVPATADVYVLGVDLSP